MSALTVAEVLSKAADLIEPEGAWAQAAEALDVYGQPVNCMSDSAVCFCAIGAIMRIQRIPAGVRPSSRKDFYPVRNAFQSVTGMYPMPYNDAEGRTQAEVVEALRKAAALARTQPERHPS